MSDSIENTLTSYLGREFQGHLLWQILVETDFAEKVISDLSVEYFDDIYYKKLFIIIVSYFKEYEQPPNLQNKSIHLAINKFISPVGNREVEEEALFGTLKKIELWNEGVLNRKIPNNGEIIQKTTTEFIKQQEYRKLGEYILSKTKTGEIKQNNTLAIIEEKITKISRIGEDENEGILITENIDRALRKEFRQTIPTGVNVLDHVTGGSLGKGEIGLILTPSGVGKAQPLSSKILTPNGWVKMGDIRIGDYIIGSDGKPQKVLGVYKQGKRPIYKVGFDDGSEVFCDEEHLWSVNSLKQRDCSKLENGETIHIPDYSYHSKTLRNFKKIIW